jgi:hypothetical protein
LEDGTHGSQFNPFKEKMSFSKCEETIKIEVLEVIDIADDSDLSSVSVDETGNVKEKDPTKRSVSSVSGSVPELLNSLLAAGGCLTPPNAVPPKNEVSLYDRHELWKQYGCFCLLFAVLNSLDTVRDAHRLLGCAKPECSGTISERDLGNFISWNDFYGFEVEGGANTTTISCLLHQMLMRGVKTRSEAGPMLHGWEPCIERYTFRVKHDMDILHVLLDLKDYGLKKYIIIGHGTSDKDYREKVHDVLMKSFLLKEQRGRARPRAGALKRIRRPGVRGFKYCYSSLKSGLEAHYQKEYKIPSKCMSKHAVCLVMGRGVPPMLYDPGRNTPTQLFESYEKWRDPSSYDIDQAVVAFLVSLIFIERFYEIDIKLTYICCFFTIFNHFAFVL